MTRPLILIEDNDFKARALVRLATRAGFSPIVRGATLEEACELLDRLGTEKPAVLTDWCFPALRDGQSEDNMGRHVVTRCRALGLEVRVFSGRSVPAVGFEDIWFDAIGINGLNEWLEKNGGGA